MLIASSRYNIQHGGCTITSVKKERPLYSNSNEPRVGLRRTNRTCNACVWAYPAWAFTYTDTLLSFEISTIVNYSPAYDYLKKRCVTSHSSIAVSPVDAHTMSLNFLIDRSFTRQTTPGRGDSFRFKHHHSNVPAHLRTKYKTAVVCHFNTLLCLAQMWKLKSWCLAANDRADS